MGAAVLAAVSCERIEVVIEDVVPMPATPHEAYLASLVDAGLESTTLAERWRSAAEAALRSPVRLDPPFEEVAFYPAEEPTAGSYAVTIDRGQSINISYTTDPPDAGGVFLDLYRVEPDATVRHVAHAPEGTTRLEFEPSREGDFLVRVQPELLRDVRVRLRIVKAAVLAFPVMDHDAGAIQSRFGVARDGGRRQHHGVDIFAPRGTPVLAASDGVVSRVGDQRLGGRVVWLRDSERGTSQYYAHMDRQLVRRGQRVRAGDTLGLVGNTGNARTTPPHLHFGLYRRGEGPIDPYTWLEAPPDEPPRLRADTTNLGRWLRTRGATVSVELDGGEGASLQPYTVVRVLGAAGRALRVRLPDGRVGLVRTSLESLDTPIDRAALAAGASILAAPDAAAPARSMLAEEATIPVVGRFSDFLMVRAPDGSDAWIEAPPASPR